MNSLPKALREKMRLRKESREAESNGTSRTASSNSLLDVKKLLSGDEEWPEPPDFPLSSSPCASCGNDCSYDLYPESRKGRIDTTSKLAGSVKPYINHVIIATAKLDWPKEVTNETNSFAHSLKEEIDKHKLASKKRTIVANSNYPPKKIGSEKTRLIALPAWKIIDDITNEDARDVSDFLYDKKEMGIDATWESIVLVCSHRTRDKRCGITAPYLMKAFEAELREHDLYRSHDDSTPGGVLLITTSHIGGHKFAGNVIVYRKTKEGEVQGIWLGRVEPFHVPQIVSDTIIKGQVWKELLRGGIRVRDW